MRAPVLALLLFFGLAQECRWGRALMEADTVWLGLPHTARWLESRRKAFRLREARSNLPCPRGFLTRASFATLLHLCASKDGLRWWWALDSDTFCLISALIPLHHLARNLVLLRGPCAGGPQEIEIMAVFRSRGADLSAQDKAWGWQPFFPQAWENVIVAPLSLPHRYSASAVTAMSFVLVRQASHKPFYLQEVRLYGYKSTFLTRDELIATYARRQLPRGFLSELRRVWQAQPPYGYVIRVNDYYPASVGEGVVWVEILTEGQCVRPNSLIERQDGQERLRPMWEERLQGKPTPLLPLWDFR